MSYVLEVLGARMQRPEPYGVFHLLWVLAALFLVFLLRKQSGEKHRRIIFAIYGWTALALEALKQLSWSFSFSPAGVLVFEYQWYAAPFQLCTMPAYVAALYPFVRAPRLRAALRSFLAYFTILASICVALLPDAIYTEEVLINVHTSFLHMGGLFLSLWLLCSGQVRAKADFWGGYLVFLGLAGTALLMNILVYHLFDLKAKAALFDMFYISPYYLSPVPVFSTLDSALPYPVFLFLYVLAFLLGGLLIALTEAGLRRLTARTA